MNSRGDAPTLPPRVVTYAPVMEGPRSPASWLVLAGALLASASARAAEPWPPATPPRVDLTDAPPVAPKPKPPAAPVPVPAAAPAPVPAAASAPVAAPPPAARAPTLEFEPIATNGRDTSDDGPTELRATFEPEPRARSYSYGTKDGQLFLRTHRDELVLLPSARLELDGRSMTATNPDAPDQALSVGLARLDAAGWIASRVYFDLSADFASGPSLRHVDNFVAVAPWDDRVIFQLGQFDAPFTLENRTADRYLDFVGRGAAVRGFAIAENKDQGLMVHGTNPERNYYYSAAVLNGAGPSVTGVDGQFDVMARGWVAPLSFRGPDLLHDVTFGASLWTGDRVTGQVFSGLQTQGGYTALDPSAWWMSGPPSSLVVRERGRLYAGALELNAPVGHRLGVRFEWIGKRQPYSAFDVSDPAHPAVAAGLNLSGWATYAEVWGWVLGDDRMLGVGAAPGLELPVRYRDLADASPKNGLMLAARFDYVDEDVTPTSYATLAQLGAASAGTTKLAAVTLGASYWYTRRARLEVNYVFNHLDGTTPYLNGLAAKNEQELLVRTAFAL